MEPPPPEAPQHLPEHPEDFSEAEQAKPRKEDETVSLGRTYIRDASEANAFPKLSGYEAALKHSLYKALHELQRLQAARGTGGRVPPPSAIDVQVSDISGKSSENGFVS